MRIGVMHPRFTTVGGAEVLLGRYALHLRGLGHEVRLVTTALDPSRWPVLAAELEVRTVGTPWTDSLSPRPTATKQERRATRLAAAAGGVDVLLAGNYPSVPAAVQARDVGRTVWWCMEPSRRLHNRVNFRTLADRVAATPRGADSALLAYGRRMMERRNAKRRSPGVIAEVAADVAAVQRVTRVVAISEFSAETVRLAYGRAPDAVVYPTVPDPDSRRRAPGVDPGGLRVLVHSRLDRMKNIDTVLKGFAAFRERHPGTHEIHVVGRGPDERRLRAVAQRLGLGSSARFHGFLGATALNDVYARCEIMALLPVDEPFGMVFPEAALRGLLLAGPDHGGPCEILDGGQLGWALDVFSHEPLADALGEAWHLPIAEVERRREHAAASCRARFGPAATLPRVITQVLG